MNRDCDWTGCTRKTQWVMLWSCWNCEKYTETFYCRVHGATYENFYSAIAFDWCGKCRMYTAEYLLHKEPR